MKKNNPPDSDSYAKRANKQKDLECLTNQQQKGCSHFLSHFLVTTRVSNALPREEMAKSLDYNLNHYNKLENNSVPITKLAHALGHLKLLSEIGLVNNQPVNKKFTNAVNQLLEVMEEHMTLVCAHKGDDI